MPPAVYPIEGNSTPAISVVVAWLIESTAGLARQRTLAG
jgi:hypothetical protein